MSGNIDGSLRNGEKECEITAAFTQDEKKWVGWGTALKPANEPIVVARKLLAEKTVAKNVLKYGTGGINIDGCRIATKENLNGGTYSGQERKRDNYASSDVDADISLTRLRRGIGEFCQPEGRWPANLILDDSEQVLAIFPYGKSGSGDKHSKTQDGNIFSI